MSQIGDNICGGIEELMADVLFGDPDSRTREKLDEHLLGCDACREEFDSLRATIELSRSRVRVEPDAAFWQDFESTVLDRLAPLSPPRMRLVSPLTFQSRWPARLVAASLLLAVGFGIGKMASIPGPTAGHSALRADGAGSVVDDEQQRGIARTASLQEEANDLLADSELVLLQFVNDASHPRGASLAEGLGRRAEFVRASLDESGDRKMQELIRELEFVLLQIANLDATNDSPGVELVRDAIDRRALLFRINREQLQHTSRDRQLLAPQ